MGKLKDDDIVIDDSGNTAFTSSDLEDLINRAQADFGRPSQIFMSPQTFNAMGQLWGSSTSFNLTPWENKWRITKREAKFAGLHTTIKKLGMLKGSQVNVDIYNSAVKRLKRAKWARYQKV
jgi:hypothetical protein